MVACWIIFAALLLFIPIGFGYFGVLCTKKFNPNEQQKKNMNLSLCKYIFLFWLYDLLFKIGRASCRERVCMRV